MFNFAAEFVMGSKKWGNQLRKPQAELEKTIIK